MIAKNAFVRAFKISSPAKNDPLMQEHITRVPSMNCRYFS